VALDSTAAAEGRGPLAGLTVAVKDVIDVAGLPTRNGTAGAMWSDPPESASAWQRLADAGARCVGKAATHEMAWGVTTPQIPHPQAVDKMAGGSSGGPAACVAAGVTSGALGTDTGGSVRIPAALCGVVGFRPTTGSVDMVGVTPLAPEQDVVGPLATDVATCAVLLEALLGRRLQTDALPGVPAGRSGDGVMPQPLRVGVLARPGRLQADVERAFGDTVDHLRGHGVEIVQCETALLRQAGSVSLLTMLRSSAALHAEAARANPGGLGGGTRALLTVGEAITTHDAQVVCRARSVLVAQTARLFADNELDAFLTPTTPCTAPPRLADEVDIAGRLEPVSVALTRFTAWASVTSMPAVSVPVPSRGLPIGMQLMAPPSHDDVCVSLALTVEEMTRRTTP
jgi:aspartyl-tRNA(Asn)/glutamyl-tRNA(Gln) amidotransferase subunit A